MNAVTVDSKDLRGLRINAGMTYRKVADSLSHLKTPITMDRTAIFRIEERGTEKNGILRGLAEVYNIDFEVVEIAAQVSRKNYQDSLVKR